MKKLSDLIQNHLLDTANSVPDVPLFKEVATHESVKNKRMPTTVSVRSAAMSRPHCKILPSQKRS